MNLRNSRSQLASLVSIASVTLLGFGLAGCKSGEASDGSSKSAVMNARAPIASYRSKLDQIKPRVAATVDSAANMLAKADADPKGGIRTFTENVTRLKSDAQAMREQADELERLGHHQYFLGSGRTTAMSSDPAVTEARTKYGFVGDYMVSLRNKGTKLMSELESISTAVNANPTAEGIRSQSAAISRLIPTKIEIESVIDLLTSSIDTMDRR